MTLMLEELSAIYNKYLQLSKEYDWNAYLKLEDKSRPSYGLMMYEMVCRRLGISYRDYDLFTPYLDLKKRYQSGLLEISDHGVFLDSILLESEERHVVKSLAKPTTLATNWSLIYSKNCLLCGNPAAQGILSNLRRRMRGGFIYDSRTTFSMQYAFFSLVQLQEIGKIIDLGQYNIDTSDLLSKMTSLCWDDWECNWIGRGRYQLFGYVSALEALVNEYLSNPNGTIGYDKLKNSILSIIDILNSRFAKTTLPISVDPHTGEEDSLLHGYNNKVDYVFFFLYRVGKLKDTLGAAELDSSRFIGQLSNDDKVSRLEEPRKNPTFDLRLYFKDHLVILDGQNNDAGAYSLYRGHLSMFSVPGLRTTKLEFLDDSMLIKRAIIRASQVLSNFGITICLRGWIFILTLSPAYACLRKYNTIHVCKI